MQSQINGKDSKKKLGELSRSQLNSLFEEWILNERDKKLVKRRFLDGIIYEDLSEEFGLSVRQTKKIVYKYRNKIAEHI